MFGKYFHKVNACEIVPLHCDILESNVKQYGLNNVSVYCDDYMNIMNDLKQDVVFFDPPWEGKKYKYQESINLGINNINIACIINKLNAKYVFLRVPFNFDLNNFINLIDNKKIRIYPLNSVCKFQMLICFIKHRTVVKQG